MRAAANLGAPRDYAQSHQWTLQPEAPVLANAGTDVYGRGLRLAPKAADALHAMVAAAARDGVTVQVVSGFRSFGYQRRLLHRKLDRGVPLAAVLEVNALPGFSEHHSGCALDLTTPGLPATDAAFATTPAFAWLLAHARRFGFALSYPPGNAQGVDFEPWHWRYAGIPPAAGRASVAAAPATSSARAVARGEAAAPAHSAATLAGLSIQTYPR
ncbi:D-alanyl-D-alanine carboxypeptidase family protein [Frateuria hangzhouensis]|uniref:D-alanyl-D-alanine carboxypeptidase family protein n=1 Tax=Frateuria hangzhouensis TaxID=2995589 RepID=UPI002260EE76|nr:D-alanyl-D-alanine carboxypeptidase family protein [Frateuria sp. STR12]MCX7513605.1 D-alanyl-D-alanine carboxypeptidase family protein [Frateuria sp. STR12]